MASDKIKSLSAASGRGREMINRDGYAEGLPFALRERGDELGAEEREQRIIAGQIARGRKPRTILRDRIGGVTANLSLRQLREETEAGMVRQVPEWRESSCSCFSQLF